MQYQKRPTTGNLRLLAPGEIPDATDEQPCAIEMERATLGAILRNRDSLLAVLDTLRPEMFYQERHRLIYQAMLGCFHARVPPDTQTVYEALRTAGQIELVGGVEYLSDLTDACPSSYSIQHYAGSVIDTAYKRRQIQAGAKIASLGYTPGLSSEEAATEAHAILTAATARHARADLVSGADAAAESWEDLASEKEAYIPTGWPRIDSLMGGLHGGDLILVGARPSVGKTSWALSLLRNVCRAGRSVLIFELEMSRLQLTQRLVAMESHVETRVLRLRAIPDIETHRALAEAHATVGGWDWTVCDLSSQTPLQIRARTMRHLAEHPGSLVIVDYLGLMGSDEKRENRTQEVSALSLALKNLAREANVPIVALCQLSRASEQRSDKRPVLSDLRESGSLEQDADIVAFLYREELHDRQTDNKGIMEFIVAKNRNGPVGVELLRFDAATTAVQSLTYRTEEAR